MIELRISPGGRRFLARRTDPAVQTDTGVGVDELRIHPHVRTGRKTGPVLQWWTGDARGVERHASDAYRQLQVEKNRLYAQLGRGDDTRVLDAISERIRAQITLLSERVAAEGRVSRQASKALVPVASKALVPDVHTAPEA